MKKKYIVNYLELRCELILTQKGDWGYIDKEFWWLWRSANDLKEGHFLEQNGFSLFDRNVYYKEISHEEANDLLGEDFFTPMQIEKIKQVIKDFSYTIYTRKDKGYDYLPSNDDLCICVENYEPMYIDIEIEDECTLTFAGWHTHYYPESLSKLERNLEIILFKKACTAYIKCNDNWLCSLLLEQEKQNIEYIKNKIKDFFSFSKKYDNIKQYGIEVQLSYWDKTLNKIFKIDASEFFN